VKILVNDMKVYPFNNTPPRPFYFFHMFPYGSNISPLFVSISILILLYNIDMKRHINMCLFMFFF
jgi:hypothetical protein